MKFKKITIMNLNLKKFNLYSFYFPCFYSVKWACVWQMFLVFWYPFWMLCWWNLRTRTLINLSCFIVNCLYPLDSVLTTQLWSMLHTQKCECGNHVWSYSETLHIQRINHKLVQLLVKQKFRKHFWWHCCKVTWLVIYSHPKATGYVRKCNPLFKGSFPVIF